MRIDSYLWCIRFYKTRSIATNACKKGSVKVNDKTVKPSRQVFQGDILKLRKQQIHYTFQVLDLPKSRLGAKLVDLYRRDTTPKEAFANAELLKYAKDYYRKKGTGRPSKKDRRDIDDFKHKSLEEE